MRDWIDKAIKHPGRVREYMMEKYGPEAFTKDGKIKVEYIDKELKRLKKGGLTEREKSLFSALELAKRFKVGDLSRKGKKRTNMSKSKKNNKKSSKKKSSIGLFEELWEL